MVRKELSRDLCWGCEKVWVAIRDICAPRFRSSLATIRRPASEARSANARLTALATIQAKVTSIRAPGTTCLRAEIGEGNLEIVSRPNKTFATGGKGVRCGLGLRAEKNTMKGMEAKNVATGEVDAMRWTSA